MEPKSVDIAFYEREVDSPVGPLRVVTDAHTLLEVSFHGREGIKVPSPNAGEEPEILKQAVQQLKDYFDGKRRDFELPLGPSGTDFQQRVWKELLTIPYGGTISYAVLAKRLGDPKCIRAAASANGRNPIAIIIPCHRVVGSNGDLTGYGGGLPRKKLLLDLEARQAGGKLTLF
jgi:methylated-DNA-[protein]-cysteine S-methyltransferase